MKEINETLKKWMKRSNIEIRNKHVNDEQKVRREQQFLSKAQRAKF